MSNTFHKTSIVSPLSDIESSTRGSTLELGEESEIDSFVKIKFSGGMGNIKIGKRCFFNSGCSLYSGNGISISDNVIVAANCTFAPTNHAYSDRGKPTRDQGFLPSKGGIIIEEDVWIGAGTVVLDGSIIKKGCVIGANSLVRGELDAYGVYVGTPAKLIKYREEK